MKRKRECYLLLDKARFHHLSVFSVLFKPLKNISFQVEQRIEGSVRVAW